MKQLNIFVYVLMNSGVVSMVDIKLMIVVGGGEVYALTIPQAMWYKNNVQAHYEIHQLINAAFVNLEESEDMEEGIQEWIEGPWDDEDSEFYGDEEFEDENEFEGDQYEGEVVNG
jgi:hypothetical protein